MTHQPFFKNRATREKCRKVRFIQRHMWNASESWDWPPWPDGYFIHEYLPYARRALAERCFNK